MLLINTIHLFFIKNILQTQSYYLFTYFLNHNWWNYFIIYFILVILLKQTNFLFFYFLMFNSYFKLVAYVKIPNTLLIGFNNIHPLLFYTIFILFLSTMYSEFFLFKTKNFKLKITTLTLLLGGLWGTGNSVWGFFWVNDQIELVLLLYILLQLSIIHIFNVKKNQNFFILSYIIFIGYILILRWGFIFTRHSFINIKLFINFYKINFLIFFGINFLFLIVLFIYKYYLYFLVYFINRYLYSNNFFKIFYLILHLIVCIFFFVWVKYKIMNNTFFFYNYFCSYFFYLNISVYLNKFFFFLKKRLLILQVQILSVYSVKTYFFFKNIFVNYISIIFLFFFLKSKLRFILNKYIIKSSRRWI